MPDMKSIPFDLLLPDIDQIKRVLSYDPETGELRWITSTNRTLKAGSIAGSPSKDGHIKIAYKRKTYMAHRLAWAIHTGQHPAGMIDHKNGNPADNRFSNLRLCCHAENSQNSRKRAGSTSHLKGVCRLPNGKFQSQIKVKGRKVYLGTFSNEIDAALAYDFAALASFGSFAKINFDGSPPPMTAAHQATKEPSK